MPKKASSRALAVVDLDQLTPEQLQVSNVGHSNALDTWLETLGKRARAELDAIEFAERMTPVRAIFLGVILAQVRAGLRGRFRSWVQEHFGSRRSSAYNYMAIAKVCVADARILVPELVALPQLPLDFAPSDPKGDAARALKKIERWIGKRPLRELYRLHARKQPSLIEKAAKKALMPDAARALAKTELSGWLEQGRQLLVTENRCSLLLAAEVRDFAKGLDAMLTLWRRGVRKILED